MAVAYAIDSESRFTPLVDLKTLRKSPVRAFLWLSQRLWQRIPAPWTGLRPICFYGDFLYKLSRTHGARAQAFTTVFLRNRPELELIRRVADRKGQGETLRVAVLGCSTGAQAYSVAWSIRSARPDLNLVLHAVDISKEAVQIAESGVYSLTAAQLANTNIAERMTTTELDAVFRKDGNVVTVKPWIRDGIKWHVIDVAKPELLNILGPQDLVVANNFLCHMEPPKAESCMRNIARLLTPNAFIFVSGVDLDVRTKVASELGWRPHQELLEEIHEADPWLRGNWPFQYAGLEPLNKRKRDWRIRYASAFQASPTGVLPSANHENEHANA